MDAPLTDAPASAQTTPRTPAGRGFLQRAIVSLPEAMCGHHDPLHERFVFFESPNLPPADARLELLLALAWNIDTHGWTDSGLIYNIYGEAELLGEHAGGDASTGDMRLFEIGWGPGDAIRYTDPARVDLFVSPQTHARLSAALKALPVTGGAA